MGIWSTIGHAALKYGPYAAAPFTGGASLALIPATSAVDSVWSAAQNSTAGPKSVKAMNTYGPSGITEVGKTWSPTELQQMFPNGPTGAQTPTTNPGIGPSNPSVAGSQAGGGNIFKPLDSYSQPRGLFSQKRGMMPEDSSNPNLSFALNQGKRTALQNQPWRRSAGIYPRIGQKKPATEVTEA